MPDSGNLLHIASEPGAGATSLALQIIKSSLESDGRIVWIGREMPDPSRLSDILSSVPPTALSRFHAGAFGEHLTRGIEQSLDLIEGLDSITHVVIDDWAGSSGRVDKQLIQIMQNLIDTCHKKCTLIVTSSMYADASGKDEWAIRGPEIFGTLWRLIRKNSNSATRLLDVGDHVLELIPDDNGFVFTHHSS